jgi:hypothetical protein
MVDGVGTSAGAIAAWPGVVIPVASDDAAMTPTPTDSARMRRRTALVGLAGAKSDTKFPMIGDGNPYTVERHAVNVTPRRTIVGNATALAIS